MKKIVSLLTVLVISAGLAHADKTITVKKASETTAKVACEMGKGGPAMVPIKFDDGASWDNVKDTYNVSDDIANSLMNGTESISIGTDGTATFHARIWHKIKHAITGKA